RGRPPQGRLRVRGRNLRPGQRPGGAGRDSRTGHRPRGSGRGRRRRSHHRTRIGGAMTQASETGLSARWRGISGNDLAAGLLCLAIAAIALFNVTNLRFGTVMRMGPGFTPTVLSWLLAGFGVALIGVAVARGS